MKPRAAITLEKRIPSGGGLGGGSSDAAVTLLGLSALWQLDLSLERLAEIGAAVGSDVPFFLWGGTARGRGRGERIEPLPDDLPRGRRPRHASVSRRDARGLPAPRGSGVGRIRRRTLSREAASPTGTTSSPPPSRSSRPFATVREALGAAGAEQARLSGSGSTVFGLFPDLATASEASRRLEGLPPGSAVRVVPTLTREESRSRSGPRRAE